jgi:hypothetical protein
MRKELTTALETTRLRKYEETEINKAEVNLESFNASL